MTDYTIIPEAYLDEQYEYYFSKQKLKDEYNGDVLKACEDDPALFAHYMLGFTLRDYQLYLMIKLVEDRYVFALMGRRMGKSTVFKIFNAWALWYNKYPQGRDNTTKVLVLAHTSDSAESYIEELRDIYEAGDRRVEQVFKGKLGKKYFTGHFPKKGKDNARINTTELAIFNGGWNKIMAFPPTPRARGRAASIVQLDELGFWSDYTPDEYKIYREVVRPIITDSPGTKIFAATTPNGPAGLAYDIFPIDNHKTVFTGMWFPFYYRKEKEYLDEIDIVREEYESTGDYDSFRQEFLAEWVSKGKSYFQKEKEIDKVFADESLGIMSSFSGPCHAAIDFGGSVKSRTVITVSRVDEKGHMYRIYHKRYPVGKDSTLKEDVMNIARKFSGIERWHIDSQGGGSAFYDWFRTTFGGYAVDEVTFRGRKADMYRLFKIACFKGRIKSYYDPELRDEFLGFTSDLKPSKHTTDDMLDSFVLSCIDWLEEKGKSSFRILRY